MSLGAKLTLWLLIPLLAVLTVLAALTLQRGREAHHRQAASEVERIANTLAIPMAEALRRDASADLSEIVRRSTLALTSRQAAAGLLPKTERVQP